MRRLDDSPIDPEIAASLDAIDATLAGEPVDPKYAELAELALLLSAGRPECSAEFARTMDERVGRRFAAAPSAAAGGSGAPPRQGRRRSWWLAPAFGSGLVAAGVAVAIALSSSGSSPTVDLLNAAPPLTSAASGAATSTASTPTPAPKAPAAGGVATSSAGRSSEGLALSTSRSIHAAANSSAASAAPTQFGPATAAPGPTLPNNGRKVIQSAQLALTAPPKHIDDVAQELFDVVGQESGIVQHSSVTASNSPNAYAEFQLSIPSSNLPQTMAALSRLRYASVSSRTDNSQDVNNQYVGDLRKLSDDRALRTALLKQLANATTTQQIDSLNQRIHDADNAIAADQATISSLNHKVNYSQVDVTVNAGSVVPAVHHSGGFTIGKAAHDAGRVLTVAAGVALIALAVLVPLGLLAGFGWWVVTAVQRRRREQALDLA